MRCGLRPPPVARNLLGIRLAHEVASGGIRDESCFSMRVRSSSPVWSGGFVNNDGFGISQVPVPIGRTPPRLGLPNDDPATNLLYGTSRSTDLPSLD